MLEAEVRRQQPAILSGERLRHARVRTANGDKVPDCNISLLIYVPAHQVKVARPPDTQ